MHVYRVYRDSADDFVTVHAATRFDAQRVGAARRGWRQDDCIVRYLVTREEESPEETREESKALDRAVSVAAMTPRDVTKASEKPKKELRPGLRNFVSRLVRT